MSDNVISLGTKRSLAQEQAEIKQAEEAHQKVLDENAENHKKNMLQILEGVKARVEAGEMEGFIIAGRNPSNGAFLSIALLDGMKTRVDTYLAYAGALDALKLDMVDMANSGPHMAPDGSYFALSAVSDPYDEMEDF